MNKIHNVDTWFKKQDGSFDLSNPLTWFEGEFEGNTIGAFKVPASTSRRFNNFNTNDDKYKCFNAIANKYITAMLSSAKGKKLKSIPWDLLEDDTQFYLKEGLGKAIQHSVLNNQIWEKVVGSSINTPNFNISVETTNWLLSSDVFGQFARTSLEASGISDYEWISEGDLISTTNNKNTKVIGRKELTDDTYWRMVI